MKLIKVLCILGISSLLFSVGVQAQQPGDPVFKGALGVQMYTFRNELRELGVEATLDIIQGMGFTEIEGGGANGMTDEEFKQLLNERGLSTPSIGIGYDEMVSNPQAIVDRANFYGAKYAMLAWIGHENGNFNFVNASQAVEDFNKAGKFLAENGLTFTYHFHGYEYIPHKDGTLMDYMMENTNPEYVSFQMDILWTHFGGGNPEHLLRKYPDRWRTMHLKDLRKGTLKDHTGLTPGTNDVVLGSGEIDIVGILKAANDIGIEHFFIEDESPDPQYQVPLSIEYLNNLRY